MIRVRDQVESFIAYGGYQEGMSVGKILAGARADRLVLKELEKNISGIIHDLASGTLANTLVTLPSVNWQPEKDKITGSNAIEIAKQVEQSYSLLL